MRIAVVGSGISGLVAADVLQTAHEITLFEANDYLGGHTHTVEVERANGEKLAIDTGFIVFNDWTYPNLIGLFDDLGVRSRPTSMGFSVRCEQCNLEYSGNSLRTLFAQPRNLWRWGHYRLLYDILRFNREAPGAVERYSAEVTLGQFLRDGSYSREFADHYLLPMGAAIWSCPMATFSQFPLQFIVEFYQNHGLLNVVERPTWRVVDGGSWSYVRRLQQRFRGETRLCCPVRRIRRHEHGVTVESVAGAEEFDEVVLACHSDQALRMLADADDVEQELLGAFPYSQNEAVLHTDVSLLPRQRAAWSSWNYHITQDEQRPTLTYNMNILQGLETPETYCVTLNESGAIAPEKVLGRFDYAHPIFTLSRKEAQTRHHEVIRHRRTSFCGAYWRNGFHEDGVVSALRVCESFGLTPRWSRLPARECVAKRKEAVVVH
jgi:predicted NAD/FAD-binding protein